MLNMCLTLVTMCYIITSKNNYDNRIIVSVRVLVAVLIIFLRYANTYTKLPEVNKGLRLILIDCIINYNLLLTDGDINIWTPHVNKK